MNKLYDAIESIVIDDDLLSKSVKQLEKNPKDSESTNDHSELETLCLSFKSISVPSLSKCCRDSKNSKFSWVQQAD